MGSAWAPGWEERIAAFARRGGHANIWEYMKTRPDGTLVELADQIGAAAAIQIENIVVDHCRASGAMEELVLNLLYRKIRGKLRKGWGAGTDFDHVMAFQVGAAVGDAWTAVVTTMFHILRREGRAPDGWLPRAPDDPLLLEALRLAMERTGNPRDAPPAPPEPGAVAWAVVEPYWELVDIYGSPDDFLVTFAQVPKIAGHLLAVRWLNSEVCNGGLHQFFHNPTGVLAPEAVEGLEAIGASKAAAVVREAMTMLGLPYPRSREKRIARLWQIEQPGEKRTEWDPFNALDDRYDATENLDALSDALAASARNGT